MTTVVTDAGRLASANAYAGGFLINIDKFKVTNCDPTLVDLDPANGSLNGTVVYEGAPDTIEAIGNGAVRFTCYIPREVPAEPATWDVSELGMFLEDGTLFSHTLLQPVYTKNTEFGLKLIIIVALENLGDVINISLSGLASVPAVAHVHMLMNPRQYEFNVVSVLDQMVNTDHTDSPGTAFKYGPGSAYWGFSGYDRVYEGKVVVVDLSTFTLDTVNNGFKLRDGDVVIVQNITANGINGNARRMLYQKGSFTEVDGIPFEAIDLNATVAIWKNRMCGGNPLFVIDPKAVTYESTANQSQFLLPVDDVDDLDVNNVVVHVDGRHVPVLARTHNAITIDPVDDKSIVDIWQLTRRFQFKYAGKAISVKTRKYTGDGTTRKFASGATIENKFYTFAYLGRAHQSRETYEIANNTRFDFNVPPEQGVEVYLVVLELVDKKNHNVVLEQFFGTAVQGTFTTITSDGLQETIPYFLGLVQYNTEVTISGDVVSTTDSLLYNKPASVIEFSPKLEVNACGDLKSTGSTGSTATQTFSGPSAPPASLGKEGDLYLNTTSLYFSKKQGATWVQLGKLTP